MSITIAPQTTGAAQLNAARAAVEPPPFDPDRPALSELRQRIAAGARRPEVECLPPLIEAARFTPEAASRVRATALTLVGALRKKGTGSGINGLMSEYELSSPEGVALMCLAEALLRIPDAATRDALIRDKIRERDWAGHLGGDRPLFVNAATWGLLVTGQVLGSSEQRGLGAALHGLVRRLGEPVIRVAVDRAIRLIGEKFVTGRTIGEALRNSRRLEQTGFRHSYDMLGEAATTAADASSYFEDYANAIHAIGREANGRGLYEAPGISIKLSALHPRYERAQIGRTITELVPRVVELAALAKRYGIGLNIDAEEADRLELSLEVLERLCFAPELVGWDGVGFVVQAYGKRCPAVIDYLVDLARRSGRRLMVRLVKGAYWDSEIKQAQIDGMSGYPVYTRKVHTDVSYLACARKLLSAPAQIYPQFATHNAQTVASIIELGGPDFHAGQYEFQCLHGMGETLYDEVVGPARLNRPCRIYAPVGSHDTLLAYLVRRLLENGANSSFVNQIADKSLSLEALVVDPVDLASRAAVVGAPHSSIPLPVGVLGETRRNSSGFDLADEADLQRIEAGLAQSRRARWRAAPSGTQADGSGRPALNPADHEDLVGRVVDARPADIARAFAEASAASASWEASAPAARADILDRAADLLQDRMALLSGLIIREAGKTIANAIGEVREAIDFLRYYGAQVRSQFDNDTHRALGVVVCISPWNFPLAIFTGQIAAALAAGNVVLAKPAEETSLIAAEAVRILHEAGIPAGVLQLLPGEGTVGAALVAHPDVAGVMFTGSTVVARAIQSQLAGRTLSTGRPIPLIAETGGQNAMIVDSSALSEQVVNDVLVSAFDSAGQRCSALRILCLQEDVADRTLTMLKGAMGELRLGRPEQLHVDVGPVITAEARDAIAGYVEVARTRARVFQLPPGDDAASGTFVPPALIEVDNLASLTREVFGPVLHVYRYRAADRVRVVEQINSLGFGLTFGLHTRLDETIAEVTDAAGVGNVYVNRNIVGAVVGVQPFGGHGLSGTGPKAGGPLYLDRLVQSAPGSTGANASGPHGGAAARFADWLDAQGHATASRRVGEAASRAPSFASQELAGPAGETNSYRLEPRGEVLLLPETEDGLLVQLGTLLATGNTPVVAADLPIGPRKLLETLPEEFRSGLVQLDDWSTGFAGVTILVEGDVSRVAEVTRRAADMDGAVRLVDALSPMDLASGRGVYALPLLVKEVSLSINTAAAGGNASLMALGDS